MSEIEWNKVTWYSKLLAVILFVAVFFLGFYLGAEFGKINSMFENSSGSNFKY